MTTRITLFKHEENEGTNKPLMSGYIQHEDGSRENVSLWENVSKGGVIYFTGEVTEITASTYVAQPKEDIGAGSGG